MRICTPSFCILVLCNICLPRQYARILPDHGWRPPEDDWVKINTDAGISFDDLKAGASVLLEIPLV